MSAQPTKVRLKVGNIEVEYEGSESFIRDELSVILKKIGDFGQVQNVAGSPSSPDLNTSKSDTHVQIELSTNTIASRTGAKSGPDLALAAAAHLTFSDGKETFKRAEILNAMKEATSYYKASMGGNLSKNLLSLVKQGRLNETSSGTYALSASEKETLEKTLA